MITGAHGMFSAGYDIGEIPDEEFEERAERLVAHPFTEAIDALEAFPYPTLAALPGHTIGGGLELALSCDLRVAARGHQARHAAGEARASSTRTPACAASSTRSARRARASCSCSAATSTRPRRSPGASSTASPQRRAGRRSRLELAGELAGNAPLSQTGNKRVIAALLARRGRAGRGGRGGADRAAPRLVRLAGHARGDARVRREDARRAGAAASGRPAPPRRPNVRNAASHAAADHPRGGPAARRDRGSRSRSRRSCERAWQARVERFARLHRHVLAGQRQVRAAAPRTAASARSRASPRPRRRCTR